MTEDPGVRLPGDRRRQNRDEAERDGIVIPGELLAKIRALAEDKANA